MHFLDHYLKRWEMSHPTLEGRRLIIQMVVGGITQYLTQVQRMPEVVERELTRKIRASIWNNKRAPVGDHVLFAPQKEGGRALLDIKARNEAIDVMWLKLYLNLGPDRPLWASLVDTLIALNVPASERHVDLSARINAFLQSWKPMRRSRTGLNEDILSLHQTAKKFGVRPEVISKDLQRLRPIWYHSDADRKIRYLNHGVSTCLRENHKVLTVGDAEALMLPDHRPTDECECKACNSIEEETGCLSPHSYASRASELLDTRSA